MHIPDGYLGPQTYIPTYVAMLGFWAAGLARMQQTLRLRQVPLLALGAAFSFVIMMFNIPIFGGTTGHAAGAVLVAILLGPWAAVIAVSLALIVQALLFGDGGITAIGANCFNMAVVMPFVGWGVYRLIAGASPAPWRRTLGAAVAGYVGLNTAALTTAVMFGIQPLLAHDAAGHPLYAPFGLGIAVTAMGLEHLLLFGFVEAVVTGMAVAALQRTAAELFTPQASPRASLITKLSIAMAVLVVLSPLGLYLPEAFKAESAWGEWGSKEIAAEMAKAGVGHRAPAGLVQAEAHGWKALMPDYALPTQGDAPLPALSATYLLSGVLGVSVLAALLLLARTLLTRKDDADDASPVDAHAPHG